MKDINKLVRPNILILKPYSSARDEFEGQAKIWLDANENPYNNGLNRYPDPHQKDLKWSLARKKGVSPLQVFIGNGSDEAIDLLIRIFCEPGKDHILTFPPTYGMYKVSAATNDVKVLTCPLDENFQIDVNEALSIINEKQPKLTFVCSPNNPTGNLMHAEAIEQLLAQDTIVVVDEAYIDFASTRSWVSRLDEFNNLVIMQTLSKAYGLAGLRVGMAFANEPITKLMEKVKPPYNVDTLAQKRALEAVRSFDKTTVDHLLTERKKLEKELIALPEIQKVHPSDANFLLVEFSDAQKTYQELLEKGIVLRDRSSQVKNCLRITVGTPEENEKLLSALKGETQKLSVERTAQVHRKTTETDIQVAINLDNHRETTIQTGLGFFDHMLEQISRHGKVGLKIVVKGDLHIDEHHSIEDTALALGQAFREAMGDKKGIERYGFMLPMDDCLAQVAIDFGGRPWLEWNADFKREKVGDLPTEMFSHFFKSFSDAALCNLNVKAEGENEHHKIEAIFKAFAKAIKMAIKVEGDELPSTKGKL